MAPYSEIELVRVLSDQGPGDMYTLLRELSLYIERALEDNLDIDGQIVDLKPLDNTVFNLSLSMDIPVAEGTVAAFLEAADFFIPDRENRGFTLGIPFYILDQLGAAVVASAGNGAASEMFHPALFPDVIGVGSTNFGGEKSCFSNTATIYAPGGEGNNPTTDCSGTIEVQCSNTKVCQYGLVSKTTAGYGVWAGTSFSAPLVSGTVALMKQAGCDASDIKSKLLSEATSNTSGDLVINVDEAVKSCLP
jgi:hypothetical protein